MNHSNHANILTQGQGKLHKNVSNISCYQKKTHYLPTFTHYLAFYGLRIARVHPVISLMGNQSHIPAGVWPSAPCTHSH